MTGPLEPRGEDRLDLAFSALTDRARREVIRLLLQRPQCPGELAEAIGMSPQALSRHLRVLRRAGFIEAEQNVAGDARVRLYGVHPQAFQPVRAWMAHVEYAWRRQLDSFKSFAEGTHRRRHQKP